MEKKELEAIVKMHNALSSVMSALEYPTMDFWPSGKDKLMVECKEAQKAWREAIQENTVKLSTADLDMIDHIQSR